MILELTGYLSNLGLDFKPLNVKANNFGSVMISSIGGFKLTNAFAPLCRKF